MEIPLFDIIISAQNGQRSGQKLLYDYTYESLAAIISLYVSDKSERDWVFNVGMLKVYHSLYMFQQGSNYLGWARTILVRAAIDHFRSNVKNKTTLIPLDENHHNIANEQLDPILNTLDTGYITQLIQALPDNERMVFTLFEVEGFSHKEIETKTGLNMNTSKWILAKARSSMRKSIQSINETLKIK